jgi:hypothetical protein
MKTGRCSSLVETRNGSDRTRVSTSRGRRISKVIANTGAWDCAYHYYYDGDSLVETRNGS